MRSTDSASPSPGARRAAYVLGGLAVAFIFVDALGKTLALAPVVEGTLHLGYPAGAVVAIGVIELVCLAAYVIPRTSIVGAVLLTGYLGGAIASHMRIGSPLLTHVLFPTYVAALVWGALVLRDAGLRDLVLARRR